MDTQENHEPGQFEHLTKQLELLGTFVYCLTKFCSDIGGPKDSQRLRKKIHQLSAQARNHAITVHRELAQFGESSTSDAIDNLHKKLNLDYKRLLADLSRINTEIDSLEQKYPNPKAASTSSTTEANVSSRLHSSGVQEGLFVDEFEDTHRGNTSLSIEEALRSSSDDDDDVAGPLLKLKTLEGEIRLRRLNVDTDQEEFSRIVEVNSELQDLLQASKEMNRHIEEQNDAIHNIHDDIAFADRTVARGNKELSKAHGWTTMGFTVLGAVVGGAIGGPVGLIAGAKAGVALGVGGATLGAVVGWGGNKLAKKINGVKKTD